MKMTSTRPYLLRALHEWILDNDLTPYVQVDATMENVEVPQQFVQDGRIVLNLSPASVRNLDLGNEWISFNARFSGSAMQVFLPIQSVLAIYSKENGQGMFFQPEAPEPVAAEPDMDEETPVQRTLSSVDEDTATPNQQAAPPRPPRGKPALKRVK